VDVYTHACGRAHVPLRILILTVRACAPPDMSLEPRASAPLGLHRLVKHMLPHAPMRMSVSHACSLPARRRTPQDAVACQDAREHAQPPGQLQDPQGPHHHRPGVVAGGCACVGVWYLWASSPARSCCRWVCVCGCVVPVGIITSQEMLQVGVHVWACGTCGHHHQPFCAVFLCS